MRKMRSAFALAAVCLAGLVSCSTGGDALFTSFSYSGHDARFDRTIDPQGQYFNPILAGFFPDPSICRRGDDYYLVNSSFSFYPGVPIFHSRDMVNWTQHGFVLNRPSQLNLDGIRMDGGVYAPSISYNPADSLFYMVNTIVDGIGNFYVTASDPLAGVWSDPVLLPQVQGIDPSFFFDEDGRAYVVYNGECPGEPQWEGHRAIWMYEFDYGAGCVKGEKILLVDGGVDRSAHPVWIEGPHLLKKDGRYCLFAAEGGTNEGHSEVAFLSDRVTGPYVPAKNNPILTQRDLPEDRPDKVSCTGHADMVQTPEGDWWAVFLGCRPYEDRHYNTGRETFLLPVEWVDGAPVILPGETPVPVVVDKPGLGEPAARPLSGNFSWTDDFSTLDDKWMQIRTPHSQWWSLDGGLRITPSEYTIQDRGVNPSFMGVRQQHASFDAVTTLEFTAVDNALAGVAIFQKEWANYVLGKQLIDGVPSVVLYVRDSMEPQRMVAAQALSKADARKALELKVSGDGAAYSFHYRVKGDQAWIQLGPVQDGRILSTDSAGGFTGVMIGCYATSGAVSE